MGKNILIIEDDELIRDVLKQLLEREGYNVTTARNGKIGIELFQAEPSDLVITDLIMPEKEGIETIRELRKDYPDLKIIAISGGGNIIAPTEYLNIAQRLGVQKTLSKPFKTEEILEAIRQLLPS
jgi:CheY-like chemotaxis protein